MSNKEFDVLLVGAGAMSATLGTLLRELDPTLTIGIVERLEHVANESTDGWNNAGTGHAAYCELNYTSEDENGDIDISKALTINSQFEVSLQFWSYLVENNKLPQAETFINRTPHKSFVWGEKNVEFLRKRFHKMNTHHLFEGMEFTENPATVEAWVPLVMRGRDANTPIAATKVEHGSDIDFGAIARNMIAHLAKQDHFDLMVGHSVEEINKNDDGTWKVTVEPKGNKSYDIQAKFVFLGAGGGALPLLQKSDIPECKGYGGFPVTGQWLVCTNPVIVNQHHAKVYGKAPVGAPPMSVPHLDTRNIGETDALLFGPFAGFTTKFLKKGSIMDLVSSIKVGNIKPMLSVGMNNMDLTKYLISEVFQSSTERMDALREFYPLAKDSDWSLANAGQRVQIIKKDAQGNGKLEFGTEIVSSADGSLAALLGASPGASTAVNTMVNVIERCFANRFDSADWHAKIKEMIPSYGESLIEDAELAKKIRNYTQTTLKLKG
ncbi:MAG: malate dehydrogenase (quinone) [Oceanospirillaceae bacterium]